ncbi:unnamed protein product [Blepharisma stoltei]|uniref:Kinesin-like protein n=1 Tax=Blepharisma stoltei TaxID=1481888 RepID=A0AAU9IKR8_9CILI|nr:unnamed protein product [Blepharisma stoltei]
MADKDQRIQVIVRKRPLNSKERQRGESDILIQRSPNTLIVKEEKVKVDLTRYIEEHYFTFDGVYNEDVNNEQLYRATVQPIVQAAFQGAKVTCFAYGQTGSGKTYTMMGEASTPGLYLQAANDLFYYRDQYYPKIQLTVAFYEIYCGKLHDLLNDRHILHVREDAKQNVNIVGLQYKPVDGVETLMNIISYGMAARTTGQTGANDDSSRSHGVLEISLREGRAVKGKVTFIDLAGSERGADVSNSDAKTRFDGAEINKSLLALKECIRALDQDKKHTPFRGSKLTLVLKDSFVGNCRTVMIANVSPGINSCEHTLNSLRYADRVKELKKGGGSGSKGQDQLANALMLPRQNNNVVRYIKQEEEEQEDTPYLKMATKNTTNEYERPILKQNTNIKQSMLKNTPNKTSYISPKNQIPQRAAHDYEEIENMDIEELTAGHENLIGVILAEEERLINTHRKMIDDMVDAIKVQMALLGEVDKPGSDVELYVGELDKILAMKEDMIRGFRSQLKNFNGHLRMEEAMAKAFSSRRAPIDVFDLGSHDDDLLQDI